MTMTIKINNIFDQSPGGRIIVKILRRCDEAARLMP